MRYGRSTTTPSNPTQKCKIFSIIFNNTLEIYRNDATTMSIKTEGQSEINSMNDIVKITEIETGAAAQFPFALKNGFKELFPSAKWNALSKTWEVGTRTVKRLNEWAAKVNAEAGQLALANSELEEASLTVAEFEKIQKSIDDAIRDTREKTQKLNDVIAARCTLSEALEALKSAQAEIAAVSANLQAETDARNADVEAVNEQLSKIVNIARLKDAAQQLDRWHKQVGRPAHDKFDELQAEFYSARKALAEAGLQCEAIDWICNANFNRRDRDGVYMMRKNAWVNVTRLKWGVPEILCVRSV